VPLVAELGQYDEDPVGLLPAQFDVLVDPTGLLPSLTTVLAPRFSVFAVPFSTLVRASWRSARRLSSSGLGSSSDTATGSLATGTAAASVGGAALPAWAMPTPAVAARARLNSPAGSLRTSSPPCSAAW
jgi:hypothetical protein